MKEVNKKDEMKTTDFMKAEAKKAMDEVVSLTKKAKEKFDKSDDKTKKNIIAGVAGSVALIAGALGMKKMHDKHKKED